MLENHERLEDITDLISSTYILKITQIKITVRRFRKLTRINPGRG